MHRAAPATFLIPDLELRKGLQLGDLAKLVFRIAVEGGTVSVERTWVIVRERIPGGYMGMLDNEPDTIAENDVFWLGAELPFEPRHIIAVDHANEKSKLAASAPPPIPWDRA